MTLVFILTQEHFASPVITRVIIHELVNMIAGNAEICWLMALLWGYCCCLPFSVPKAGLIKQ